MSAPIRRIAFVSDTQRERPEVDAVDKGVSPCFDWDRPLNGVQ